MARFVAPEVSERVMQFMRHVRSVASDCEYLRCMIAYHAAPTLLGIKPATLFCPSAMGRDLDKALEECAPCLTRDLGLETAGFRNRAGALLLLVYRPELLERTLAAREAAELLRESGYVVNGADWRGLLATLGSKCSESNFPHEIGVFLGYPASDVREFMRGGPKKERSHSTDTAWRAYADVDGARRRTERFQAAKMKAAELIVAGAGLQGVAAGLSCLS